MQYFWLSFVQNYKCRAQSCPDPIYLSEALNDEKTELLSSVLGKKLCIHLLSSL